jgi:hypothetical protein
MKDDFAEWLATTYKTRGGGRLVAAAQRDAISRCRRVEESDSDLDVHYDRDGMREILERFTYSREDTEPAHQIRISGDLYTGTASLRNALRLYQQFRDWSRSTFQSRTSTPA